MQAFGILESCRGAFGVEGALDEFDVNGGSFSMMRLLV
jgi:hypothetical protein